VQDSLLQIVTAAVELQAAQSGTVELLNPDTNRLAIVTQLGFATDVISTIREINMREDSACSRALQCRNTVEVPDVLEDPAYREWASDVRKAGYRAVQSTPLISRNEALVGILSVYFDAPHVFSERNKQLSAMIGQQAADLIESRRQHEALVQLRVPDGDTRLR
jgi:GAF domain-containing protein